MRSRHLISSTPQGGATVQRGGDSFNSKLLNSKAEESLEVLSNGMASGLNSPSRPWFGITVHDEDLAKATSVKLWCGIIEKAINDLFAGTNFYTASNAGYLELATFGIEACIMTEHWMAKAVSHPLTVGEYWIGLGDTLAPDSLYRKCPMTVAMAVQKFGSKVSAKVLEKYDRSDYDMWVPIFHAIEPNPERIPGKVDKTNKVYRSVYWEEGTPDKGKEVLAFEGFDQQPFWAPRWAPSGQSQVYSLGPGSKMLGAAKQLQLKELRLQQAIDYLVRPPLVGPPQLEQAVSNMSPGGKTFLATNDIAQFKAIWEINPAAIPHVREDIQRVEGQIDQMGYVDLFKAITDMEGVQPRNDSEIGQRVEEKMTQLGPVVERVENEKLRVAIDIGFAIIMKNRVAFGVPVPPPELHGMPLKVEFVSVLAQAQRAVGIGSIERTAGFYLNMARADPSALDGFDFDEAGEIYADLSGLDPRIIKSADEIKKVRDARAQQQQMQQQAAMAPAAQQGADAVNKLAQAKATTQQANIASGFSGDTGRGPSVLESLVGKAGMPG